MISLKGKMGAASLGGLLLAVSLGTSSKHFFREVYQAQVVEKIVVGVQEKEDTYLVKTILNDGAPRDFINVDSPVELKWDASDIHADLEVGETYVISTYGFRIPLLSEYENIISVSEIKK